MKMCLKPEQHTQTTTPQPLLELNYQVDPSCTLSLPSSIRVDAAQGLIAVVLGDISTTLSIFTFSDQGLMELPPCWTVG